MEDAVAAVQGILSVGAIIARWPPEFLLRDDDLKRELARLSARDPWGNDRDLAAALALATVIALLRWLRRGVFFPFAFHYPRHRFPG
jgi:hypothetical protein